MKVLTCVSFLFQCLKSKWQELSGSLLFQAPPYIVYSTNNMSLYGHYPLPVSSSNMPSYSMAFSLFNVCILPTDCALLHFIHLLSKWVIVPVPYLVNSPSEYALLDFMVLLSWWVMFSFTGLTYVHIWSILPPSLQLSLLIRTEYHARSVA